MLDRQQYAYVLKTVVGRSEM